MAYIRDYSLRGWVYGLSLHKISVCIRMVVRPSSCGTSSEGHYTSFTTKCRSRVMCCPPLIFREEGEIAPKSTEEREIG